jgi:hypothetical protein
MTYDSAQLKSMTAQARSGVPLAEVKVPPATPRKPRSSPEWQLQYHLFKWWRGYCRTAALEPCLFFAVPNGAALSGGNAQWQKNERGRKGSMLKMTGLTAGVADCFLAVPSKAKFEYHTSQGVPHAVGMKAHAGLFLELKAPKGIVSDDQRVFAAAVVTQGYQHRVVRTLEEAIKEITEYLS